MLRVALAAVAALLFAGLAPAMAQDCNVSVEQPWASAPAGFRVQAVTIGPSCGRAAVVLIVRDDQDVPLWMDTLTTMNLEMLGLAETPGDMRIALTTWLTPFDNDPGNGAALPEWPEDGAAPTAIGDVAFQVDPALGSLDWQILRNGDAPLYCYSLELSRRTCVALDRLTHAVARIGLLVYPDTD